MKYIKTKRGPFSRTGKTVDRVVDKVKGAADEAAE